MIFYSENIKTILWCLNLSMTLRYDMIHQMNHKVLLYFHPDMKKELRSPKMNLSFMKPFGQMGLLIIIKGNNLKSIVFE